MKIGVGHKFLSAVAASGDLAAYLKLGRIAPLFQFVAAEEELFKKFDGYVRMHGALPSAKLVAEEFGTVLPEPDGAVTYWFDQIVQRHLRRGMVKIASDADEKLKTDPAEKVLSFMIDSLNMLNSDRLGPMLHDFRDAKELIEGNWLAQNEFQVQFGWQTVDDGMMSSMRGGDLVSLVGRPGMGKTYLMLHAAYHAWKHQGLKPLFVSMEMEPALIMERLAAIGTSTAHDAIKKNMWKNVTPEQGVMPQKPVKDAFLKKLATLGEADHPFHVADGNLTATVDDIDSLVAMLKPDCVYVDGAYLLQDPRERDLYKRVAITCTGLKMKIASRRRVPVFASWQFAREMMKLKKDDKPGLEHIGYSDVVGQLSSVIFGLFQAESVETLIRRKVDVLKGRSGEMGHFFTNWNFHTMDFSEWHDKKASELENVELDDV